MGMDVFGSSGNSFRANVWTWRPLWWLCAEVAPGLCAKVAYAQSNDGDGLDGPDACALAAALTEALDTGAIATLIAEGHAYLAGLPDEECKCCSGTGVRTDSTDLGMDERRCCNACDGKGKVRPFITSYSVKEVTVREFRDFLAASDGFEIW